MKSSSKKFTDRKARIKYSIDTFMAKGGASIFKALLAVFLISFLLIALTRSLLFYFVPDLTLQYQHLDFWGHIYITFLELTDPGNMAQDILSSVWYKLFAIIAGIAGIVMLSALIAFITTALHEKISTLKRGRSKVIESDHTLILGWNEQRIIEIIRELSFANESEDDACVVILADKDKEEMDDIIRLRTVNNTSTRIVTRSGSASILANLEMVSIDSAKALIILATCTDTDSSDAKAISDAMVIQTILAVSRQAKADEDFVIVAEVFNDAYRDIVEKAFSDNIVTVNTSEILAKLLVQTSRSVGLSVVYNEILSFDGCEMYFYADNWRGIKFGEMAYHFPDGVPMGVRKADGSLLLNPSVDYQMLDSDEILIVADDDSTIEFLPKPVAKPRKQVIIDNRLEQSDEKELILGWNHKSATIIKEFSDYVKSGSQIDIMIHNPSEKIMQEIEGLDKAIENISVNLITKNPLNRDNLLSVKPFQYNNIIILASDGDDVNHQQVDSENIVILLLLRSIFKEFDKDSGSTNIITEVLDSQNHELVSIAGVKDIIISNRLVSMIISQISESKNIKHVYDDIFEEDGSEIYLKPVALYYDKFPVEVSFADLIDIAQQRAEVCIGVKKKVFEHDSHKNNGVTLIPDKNSHFTLVADDSLVVLSEDEL